MKKTGLVMVVGVAILLAVVVLAGCGAPPPQPSANSILVLTLYRDSGTWVFDDPTTNLEKEPFVAGIPEIIDKLVKDIPNADKGFRLLFSASPFPDHSLKMEWQKAESGGNWYYSKKYNMKGWLCPALLKYFKKAPKLIYVKAEAKKKVTPDQTK